MTLEERIKDFYYCVACDLHQEDSQMVLAFSSYWTEHSLNGKKFRAEKEKVFCVKKRFATWKRNNDKWTVKSKPTQMLNAYDEAAKLLGI